MEQRVSDNCLRSNDLGRDIRVRRDSPLKTQGSVILNESLGSNFKARETRNYACSVSQGKESQSQVSPERFRGRAVAESICDNRKSSINNI